MKKFFSTYGTIAHIERRIPVYNFPDRVCTISAGICSRNMIKENGSVSYIIAIIGFIQSVLQTVGKSHPVLNCNFHCTNAKFIVWDYCGRVMIREIRLVRMSTATFSFYLWPCVCLSVSVTTQCFVETGGWIRYDTIRDAIWTCARKPT